MQKFIYGSVDADSLIILYLRSVVSFFKLSNAFAAVLALDIQMCISHLIYHNVHHPDSCHTL